MSVLTRLFPSACSRLRVFICYAREDKALAVDIAHTLTNAGHDVFIDANSLKVATDFNEEIRNAIRRADRFIFLASRNSLARGAYPLTELGFAEKRWPAAKGAIWPVIVDPSVDAAELPSYLRAVQVHVPKGNVVADLAAEIDGSRTVRSSCLLAALALIALPVIAAGVVSNARYASYALVPPRQVVFLPTKKPGPDESWMTSPVALTVVPVSYNNDGRRDVRIVSETVRLPVGERTVAFKWFNEVDLKPNCGAEWLCVKGPVGAGTLPAQGTLLRETMFTPAPGQTLTWKDFVGFVCGGTGDTLAVSLSSETRASTLLGTKTDIRETSCRLDLKAMRESLQRKGCKEPGAALPIRLPRNCLP